MSKYMAAKYFRLSRANDKENESDSIANQRKLVDNFLKNNPDIEVITEKVDDGYSGVNFNRPAFQEMMQDISNSKINCIIVKDLSRLGRDYIEMEYYLRKVFPVYGVRFISIIDNIDTAKDSQSNELVISIKNIMNDEYCRDISIKTRSALRTKRENGDYIGACTIYGYQKSKENKNKLIKDEYASKIVQDIFKLKIEGMSALKIADKLNQLGILSPIEYKKNKGLPYPKGGYANTNNAKWSAITIIRILKDETYTGTLIQGKQSTYSYKLKNLVNKPKSEWVCIENTHEAIIKKHNFDLVQKIMNLDTRTSPNKDTVYLFSGVLICGCCGNRMTRKTVSYKDKKYFYYVCPVSKKDGCNKSYMVKEKDLIECVLKGLKCHINNVVCLGNLLDNIDMENRNKELVKKYNDQMKQNENKIVSINKFKSSLYESYINGVISKEEHSVFKKSYEKEISIFKNATIEIKKDLENILNNTSEKLKWIEHFKRFEDLKEIDRKIVIQLIQNIKIIGKKEIIISFNYAFEYENALKKLNKKDEVIEYGKSKQKKCD